MFGNLLKLINSFGWFRMFGNTGANFVPSKHGGSKRNQKENFKGKPKWDLVESYGDGTAIWRCRQNGDLKVRRVSLNSRMMSDARKYFFDRKNRYKPINLID